MNPINAQNNALTSELILSLKEEFNIYSTAQKEVSDLIFSAIYNLSQYAESFIENPDLADIESSIIPLTQSALYFDIATNANNTGDHNSDFLLSAACAFFLTKRFGNAKTIIKKINPLEFSENKCRSFLLKILFYILLDQNISVSSDKSLEEIFTLIKHFLNQQSKEDEIIEKLKTYKTTIIKSTNYDDIYYFDISYAITLNILRYSATKNLGEENKWKQYLQQKQSIKLFWPSQKLLLDRNILIGNNAVISLPTGVGKSKSIELLIRAGYIYNSYTTTVVIVPLRSLCNELSFELSKSLGHDFSINELNESIEYDIASDFWLIKKPQVVITTPEKLDYIIHHDFDFLSRIGLFIFDEAHLFTDKTRGTPFELLLTKISASLQIKQQLILLSAMFSNEEKIVDWLFPGNGELISKSNIETNPHLIAYVNKDLQLCFYNNPITKSSFSLPQAISITTLKTKGKEKKIRTFPILDKKLDTSIDISLYLADILKETGTSCIFCSRRNHIKKVFGRFKDIYSRGYKPKNPYLRKHEKELELLNNLFSDHLGINNIFSVGISYGMLPHSSTLPNGIRVCVEFYLRNHFADTVVCTSTLAQGVNIPIKNLLITNLYQGRNLISKQSLHNLFGRIARPGSYTYGSVIFTDPRISVQINSNFNLRIKDLILNPENKIITSVSMLFKDIWDEHHRFEFIDYILYSLNNGENLPKAIENLKSTISAQIKDKSKSSLVLERIELNSKNLFQIEKFISSLNFPNDISEEEYLTSICQNTLTFKLLSKENQEKLLSLFQSLYINLKKKDPSDIKIFSKTLLSIEDAEEIKHWLSSQSWLNNIYTEERILESIINFFVTKINYKPINGTDGQTEFFNITKDWIYGSSIGEISNKYNVELLKISKLCSTSISFDLSFTIDSILDILTAFKSQKTYIYNKSTLSLLAKKIKYGVNSLTEVSICEEIFNDKIISHIIANILKNQNINRYSIRGHVENNKEEILSKISKYPDNIAKIIFKA